jgi:hypothetical protein
METGLAVKDARDRKWSERDPGLYLSSGFEHIIMWTQKYPLRSSECFRYNQGDGSGHIMMMMDQMPRDTELE